jgi:hypothetical protein
MDVRLLRKPRTLVHHEALRTPQQYTGGYRPPVNARDARHAGALSVFTGA